MGVRRTQHMAERHAGQRDVAHITPFAPDQPRILEARNALPDTEFTHSTFLRFTDLLLLVGQLLGGHGVSLPRHHKSGLPDLCTIGGEIG